MVLANNLKERVNLFVSGRNLKNLDVMSRSDPRCLLFEKQGERWVKIGETETIQNNLNPDFKTSFTVDYYFEKTQHFRFCMIDSDNSSGTDYDEIGDVTVVMGKLMGAPRQVWTESLSKKGQQRGQIIVKTQTVNNQSNLVASFVANWRNVENMGGGCMGMCLERMPYRCNIMKQVPNDDNRFVIAESIPSTFRTESANTGPVSLMLGDLCNNDKNARI
jgi:Ca2+-dependent lipid-binding protein|mmetsp:Transcript_47183/g.62474  ORF Transcript_47183/g.62474 Transcript_47183/m.62474 type:complete len:219 (+) Transcript_47183:43-699(+)